MDKRIIYKNLDGGVSVIVPAENVFISVEQKASLRGVTPAELMNEAFEAGLSPEDFAATLTMTVEDIAAKDVPSPEWVWDVPTGVFETDEDTGEQFEVMEARLHEYKYKIVDVADIPTDRTARDLWEVDEADLTDGVGA